MFANFCKLNVKFQFKLHTKLCARREWFLNGTSAHKRLFHAIEVIMEVKANISNQ